MCEITCCVYCCRYAAVVSWSVLIIVIIVVARFLLGIIYDPAARRDGTAAGIDWN